MIKPLNPGSVLPWEDRPVEKNPSGLPGVSIVIPIFNAGKFLEKTLRSLLQNDLTGCEVILMDGGSTDNTEEIVDHYKDMFTAIVMEKDEGQSDAINRGFEKASHDILYWLNGDDLILKNVLGKVRRRFAQGDVDVLVGNASMTELDLSIINHFVFSDEKLKFEHLLDYASNHLVQPSVFFSRKAWETCGPLDLSMHFAMDAHLFIGMSKHFRMRHIDLDIAYSVYHQDCKTRGQRAESIAELAYVQSRHAGAEEARKTLGLLVDLFNNQAGGAETGDEVTQCQSCDVVRAQMLAQSEELRKNKDLLLKIDSMGE